MVDISWFNNWSEPVRAPRRNTIYFEAFVKSPPWILDTGYWNDNPAVWSDSSVWSDGSPVSSWFPPWSEPVRVLRRNNLYDEALVAPSFDTDFAPRDSWFQSWSEPVRVPRRNNLYDEAQPSPPFDHDFALRESWFWPLSEPVRIFWRNNNLFDIAEPITPSIPAPPDRWLSAFSEPVRRLAQHQHTDQAEPITPSIPAPPDRWLSAFSEPVRRLAQHQHTDQAEPISQIANLPAPPNSWFTPLSEPTRRKPFVQDISVLALQNVPSILGMGWFAPYSNPVWVPRKVTHVSISGFQANANPDNPTADKWNQAWSEPVRASLRTAFFNVLASPPATLPTVPAFGWFEGWQDPVRLRLPTAFAIADPLTVSVASPSDRWFTPLSEPVRVRLRNNLFDIAQPIPQFTTPAPSMASWFRLLSEPVRLPLRNTLYHDAILAPPQIAAPPPSMDSWFRLLSEPVRVPLRDTLTHEVFGPILRVTPPVVSIGWFNDLSEPVRVPLRTPYFETETLSNLSYINPVTVLVARAPTYQPYRPTPPDIYSWTYFNPLLALQFVPTPFNWTVRSPQPIDQFWVGPRPPPPPAPVTVGQWFHGWDPPVWDKPRASHFSPSAGPPVVVPLPNVNVRLQMTERKDAWSMTFLESVTPYTARVGVIELPTPSGSAGVIEGPHS